MQLYSQLVDIQMEHSKTITKLLDQFRLVQAHLQWLMSSLIIKQAVHALVSFFLSSTLYHSQAHLHGFFKHLEPLTVVILDWL
jgi:hypothetical protein